MKTFAELFVGRDDVYGTYTVPAGSQANKRGKLAGTAATRRGVVDAKLYAAHLAGKQRLGIVPIQLGNKTSWIALDVDTYTTSDLHRQLAERIRKLGLSICMTRSKSGGAHLWTFFTSPISAKTAREYAGSLVKKLKLDPKTEIFPKQETIKEEDEGSWINLPYFGDTCKGVSETGDDLLTLKEFLALADERTVGKNDLPARMQDANEAAADDPEHAGAPPCVQTMLADGVEDGDGRDSAMMQLAIYFQRAFPDEWEDRVMIAARETMHPAKGLDEAARVIKSLKRKNYQYLCAQQPMCRLCDKPTCLTREFGVGGGEAVATAVAIDAVEKLDGEEPIYRVTLGGRRFQVSGEQLINYGAFRIAAMKATDKILPQMKQPNWEKIIGEQLAEMTITAAPADTQTADQVVNKFKEWASQSASKEKPDVIVDQGTPYYDGKSIFFRGDNFLATIEKTFRIPRHELWIHLRDWGVVEDWLTIRKEKVRVWRYQTGKTDTWFDITERDRI